MDSFLATVTASGLVLEFLDTCSAHSEEAESLQTRFNWDVEVLKSPLQLFTQRKVLATAQQLTAENAAVLAQTLTYFEGLLASWRGFYGRLNATNA